MGECLYGIHPNIKTPALSSGRRNDGSALRERSTVFLFQKDTQSYIKLPNLGQLSEIRRIAMQSENTPLNITLISAGAGSGKTYTLTQRMVTLLRSGVRPAGIIATTFTKKAAAELQERVRVKLLEEGLSAQANELGSALIGTVHSIGTRLLQRFAFDIGVSPLVEIIAEEDEQRLFNEALSQVLDEQRIERLNRLSDRLGLTKGSQDTPYDWRRELRQLCSVARANNFSDEVLKASCAYSISSFESLLPEVNTSLDAQQWTNQLLFHLEQSAEALDANEADSTKTTREAAEVLRNMARQLRLRGELYWHEWVKIAKVSPGAKSRDRVEALREFVLKHDEHPRFREDIFGFIRLLFELAIDALREYETYKQKRGLIDYTDMEVYVARLLRLQQVREVLAGELDLLLVDEFQDTSPIQLDIFLQLSRLARHSIWVGDPKQSIYGFRGAEPALMQAVIDATGGIQEENILKNSWRSRPDLVHCANAIFTKAFKDMPEALVALEPPAQLFPDPAAASGGLIHWRFYSELDERRAPGRPWIDHCIAEQIRTTLERGLPVYNKQRSQTRPLQAGDIAVLCRSNEDCNKVAQALHHAGLKASIARAGLLETPEGRLVLACLKYLLYARDHLAVAEIRILSAHDSLETLVADRLQWLEENPEAERRRWSQDLPLIRQLNQIRPLAGELSASEMLQLLVETLDLRRLVVSLGNAAQALDNLDMLRRYALDYESACTRLHSAATLSGFLLWLNKLAENDNDDQGSGESPDAVKVLTYHKSKGLEYPVVVCHNLDHRLREKIWGINIIQQREQPDLDDILAHRLLRFWVNPYSDQFKNTRLDDTLQNHAAWTEARRIALEEEARLLYVGLTRARDHLIFPSSANGTKWLNRVFNHGDEQLNTLDPGSAETPFYWKNRNLHCDLEKIYMPKDFAPVTPVLQAEPFHDQRPGIGEETLAAAVNVQEEWPPVPQQMQAQAPENYATAIEYTSDTEAKNLPAALLQVFAGDRLQLDATARQALAAEQLKIQGLSCEARLLLEHSSAFRQWLNNHYGAGEPVADVVLEGRIGDRTLHCNAAFILENQERIAVFGWGKGGEQVQQQVQQAMRPLCWQYYLLSKERPEKKIDLWVILPLQGQIVRLNTRTGNSNHEDPDKR